MLYDVVSTKTSPFSGFVTCRNKNSVSFSVKELIEVTFDERNGFMLFIKVVYPKRSANGKLAFNIRELKEKVDMDLKDHKIFLDNKGGMDAAMQEETVEFEKTKNTGDE